MVQKQRRSPCQNFSVSKSSAKLEIHERIQFNLAGFFCCRKSRVCVCCVWWRRHVPMRGEWSISTSNIFLLRTITQTINSNIIIKQDCIPVGCIPSACWPYLPACTAQGGVCLLRGGLLLGGLLQGGLLLGGVYFPGGVCFQRVWYPSMHWGRPPHPWTEWQTRVKT